MPISKSDRKIMVKQMMFDLITILLAAAGGGSLAGAFVEYRFSIKKRMKAKAD